LKKKPTTPAKATQATGKASATKAPAKKAQSKVAAKSTPVKAAAKPAKAAAPSKTASKTPVKQAMKVPAKAAVKAKAAPAATKAAAKKAVRNKPAAPAKATTAAKSTIKPATKSAVKPAAKPAPKTQAKPAAKTAVKPAGKGAVSPTTVKPSVKTTSKTATPKPTLPAKAAVKTTVKAAATAAETSSPNRRKSTRRGPMAPSMDATTVVASLAAKASFLLSPEPEMITPTHTPAKKDPKRADAWKSKPLTELADEDLLAMPDDEYMNDVQTAYFRAKLVTLKNDILTNAGETTEHLREDTVVVPDPADRATIEEEHALELRTRDRERKLLKKIEQSIARIDSGDYGFCDETGEPIGVGRLLARPTANLSLEAQQRRELKQKMFGD
jgi:DnaK suppressor protein